MATTGCEGRSPLSDPYQHDTSTDPNEKNFEMSLDESQATIVRQNDMMGHIDDRALNIVRTAVVLLGIIITGLNVALTGTRASQTTLLYALSDRVIVSGALGMAFLVLAVLTGVVTTQYSRPIHGTGEIPRVRIRNRSTRSRALRALAREYDDQIQEMALRIEANRKILWILQIEMVLAIALLTVATGFILQNGQIPV